MSVCVYHKTCTIFCVFIFSSACILVGNAKLLGEVKPITFLKANSRREIIVLNSRSKIRVRSFFQNSESLILLLKSWQWMLLVHRLH